MNIVTFFTLNDYGKLGLMKYFLLFIVLLICYHYLLRYSSSGNPSIAFVELINSNNIEDVYIAFVQ